MSSIDNRIVEMQFDNKQFESGVKTSLSTLEKLKQGLNLKESAKSLENLQATASKVNLSGLSTAADTIRERFSAMGIASMQVIQRLVDTAINAGTRIAQGMLQPIRDGLAEYELQMNSVQTILANTASKGTNIKQVNAALDELNTYADQTIYNFAEMTRNIGTFTAAGVDLDTAVGSIKGIANLAAASGSSSMQASTAMYQLSQAIAAGRVQLMDWNSVVNAGMGGELFQKALIRTAKNFGTNVDGMIEKYGSFRESLTKGEWLTSDILTETLKQISGAYTEADLLQKGYTKEQAKEILDLAKTATEAATKVKTFTQLIDTLKEALGSGWAQSWRIIIGDFEEAKEFWTGISDLLSNAINQSSQARNDLLQGWSDLGGRKALIEGIMSALNTVLKISGAVGKAFQDIFPPATSEQLANATKAISNFVKSLEPGKKQLDQIRRAARGVFAVFGILQQAISAVVKPFAEFLGLNFGGFAGGFLEAAANIGDFLTNFNASIKAGKGFEAVSGIIEGILTTISGLFKGLSGDFSGMEKLLGGVGTVLKDVFTVIGDNLSKVAGWAKDNISIGDIFAGLVGAGTIKTLQKFSGLLDNIKDILSKIPFLGGDDDQTPMEQATGFGDILNSLKDSLETFQQGIKVGSLVAIAGAITLLSVSLKTLSQIDGSAAIGALTAMGTMFVMLNTSFKSLLKNLTKFNGGKGVAKAAFSLILIAGAMKLLASAMKDLSVLSWDEIAKGLAGTAGGLTILSGAMKALGKTNTTIKTAAALVIVAGACKVLASAMKDMASLSWDELKRGLVGLAGGLVALSASMKVLSKSNVSLKTSVGIIALAAACKILASALKDFSGLSWDELGRGLTGMGVALTEFVAAIRVLNKVEPGKMLASATSLAIIAVAMKPLAKALGKIGSYSWETIAKGLTGMGVALAEFVIAIKALSKNDGLSGIAGAATILIAAQALKPIGDALEQIGKLSWDEIARGLVGMGVALTELALVSGILGNTAGFAGLIGATTILVGAQALKPIADALEQIGGLTWDEIKIGLVGMGLALTELAAVSGTLGVLAGASGLLGAATLVVSVQSLNPLAEALQKFGSMDWGTIAQGLVAMGAAMLEVGTISAAMGSLGGIAGLVGAGTIDLAVQGLDQLADAMLKFGSMDWNTIKQGLIAMGLAMGEVGLGSLLNTFSIFGAGSIATVAGPLGTLADSVKKWEGVSVPTGLAAQLGELADGVGKFTFAGFGAGALSSAAPGLSAMASAVQKWSSVSIPKGLKQGLTDIADGVQAFTFAFVGGFSISTVTGPLGSLAGSVKKWNGVTIPKGIKSGLTNLADGVNAFALSFAAGFSLGSLTGPLGNLATAVSKWNSVAIPSGLGTQLSSLANGVTSFTGILAGGYNLGGLAGPLGSLAAAVSRWANVLVPANIAAQLQGLASGIQSLTGIGPIIAGLVSSVNNGITQFINAFYSSVPRVQAAVAAFLRMSVAGVTSISPQFASGGRVAANAYVTALASTLLGSTGRSMSAMMSLLRTTINAGLNQVNSSRGRFQQAGVSLMNAFVNGLRSGGSGAGNAARSAANAARNAVQGYSGSFYNVGLAMMSGLRNGIYAGSAGAINAAASVAAQAYRAAKRAIDSNSPSKKFMQLGKWSDEGLQIGLLKFTNLVTKAASNVGESALIATQQQVEGINRISSGLQPITPTIQPVYSDDMIRPIQGLNFKGMKFDDPTLAKIGNGISLQKAANQAQLEAMAQQPDNTDVVDAIDALGSRIDSVADAVAQMQVVMDSQQLVGSIVTNIDTKLGQRSALKERGL